MDLLQFKEYLNTRVIALKKDLVSIETEISSLSLVKNFNLTEYGTRESFIQKYYERKPKRLINLRLKPSEAKLQQFAYNYVYEELDKKRVTLQRIIDELVYAIHRINDDGLVTEEIFPLNNVLSELLNYCQINKIDAKDFLSQLSELSRPVKKDPENAEREIISDLATYFDSNNELNSDISTANLLFILDKVFTTIIAKDKQENKEYFKQVNSYLRTLKVPKTQKKQLTSQKRAIMELQKYLKGDEIISLPNNIDEFTKLLSLAGLNEEQITKYTLLMTDALNKHKEAKEQAELKRIMSFYIAKEDLDTLAEADKLIATTDDIDTATLLVSIKNDIYSICKYIDFIKGTNEAHTSIEYLFQKLNSLKIIIDRAKNPSSIERNNFYYLTDHSHLPVLMADIELLDIVLYEDIYNQLTALGNNTVSGTKIGEKDGIGIYRLHGKSITIIYTKYNNEIIIVSIKSFTTLKNDEPISNKTFKAISKLHHTQKDDSINNLHNTYESLIANQLDLGKEHPKLTFHPSVNK